MRAVLHAGMHKTGSSSIQRTLSTVDLPGWYYPDVGGLGNHSGLWIMLFEDDPTTAHGLAAQGMTAPDAAARRRRWRADIENELAEGDRDLLVSAERVSITSTVALERAKVLISRHASEISVIAYVRQPISYMESAFQQAVKGRGERRIGGSRFWPRYRERFEKLDTVFGRENVLLKLFRPDVLLDGDVVLDFAHELGLTVSPEQVVRANEGLSLEAVALLFAQRTWGEGFVGGFRGAPGMNAAFAATLGRIGSSRLAFSAELVAPWVAGNRGDVEWIEERLGCSVLDTPQTSGRLVTSEGDLLDIAIENADALESLVGEHASEAPDVHTRVVRNLEILRQRHYAVPRRERLSGPHPGG